MADKIKVTFLGSSASVPTNTRNLTSMIINYRGENYLFDCPENVQQNIMKAKESIMKINNIFITHLHGDHFYGLFGLLSTMGLNNRIEDVNIYVPHGYKKSLNDMLKLLVTDINYKINIKEVKTNFLFTHENVLVSSVKLEHSISTYGYVFKIKDKIGKFNKKKALKLKIPEGKLFSKLQNGQSIKLNGKTITPKQVMDLKYKKIGASIAYLLDTQVLKKVPQAVKGVDLLVHDSSFLKEDALKAKKVKHAVVSEVAKFAKKAKVKKLCLTHISSRYKCLENHEKEAKKYFINLMIPKYLQYIDIKDYS